MTTSQNTSQDTSKAAQATLAAALDALLALGGEAEEDSEIALAIYEAVDSLSEAIDRIEDAFPSDFDDDDN